MHTESDGDQPQSLAHRRRERFTKALQDPNSELAQQLLSGEEIEKVRIEPWWEALGNVGEEGRGDEPPNPVDRIYILPFPNHGSAQGQPTKSSM